LRLTLLFFLMKLCSALLTVTLFAAPVAVWVGAAAGPAVAAPASTSVAPAPRSAVVENLRSTERAIAQAVSALVTATAENKGGYVERARESLAAALDNLAQARTAAEAQPALAALPTELSAETRAIDAHIRDFDPASRPNNAPNLRLALSSLQTALAYLQQTPAGSRDGHRARAIANIDQAVSELIAGINYMNAPPDLEFGRGLPNGPGR
jgi:hypothetical protein